METFKPKLEYSVENKSGSTLPVIIVAAGNASRMQGIDKQMLSLGDMPVLARTVAAFERSIFISRIIIVTKGDMLFTVQNLVNSYRFLKVSDVVEGGKDRHSSVLCGMERLKSDEKFVLIHDGARPFVRETMIEDCVLALKENDGCLTALKITDTLKSANADLMVNLTVDRSLIYAAQTPQGVNVAMFRSVSEKYPNFEFTDDASVIEKGGGTVKIVCGHRTNIKITTREDIALANAILNSDKS